MASLLETLTPKDRSRGHASPALPPQRDRSARGDMATLIRSRACVLGSRWFNSRRSKVVAHDGGFLQITIADDPDQPSAFQDREMSGLLLLLDRAGFTDRHASSTLMRSRVIERCTRMVRLVATGPGKPSSREDSSLAPPWAPRGRRGRSPGRTRWRPGRRPWPRPAPR